MKEHKVTNISKVSQMAVIGVMTAIICILGPLSIPVGLVPISFTNLAIYITLYILGTRKGVISTILYLLIGLVGVPVFSGFSSGAPKLFGPTGGYLIGFIFMALIAGYFIDNFPGKWYLSVIGMIFATGICYIFGSGWLAYQANISVKAALAIGVFPFILGDLAKIILVACIGPKIRKRLAQAGLL